MVPDDFDNTILEVFGRFCWFEKVFMKKFLWIQENEKFGVQV